MFRDIWTSVSNRCWSKRLTLFTVLIILASFIHKSVLLFYPLYFLAGFKRSNFLLIGSMISLPILFPFAGAIATFLVDFSGAEQYRWYVESEADVTAPMFLIFILFEAITVFLSKRKNDDNLPNLVVNAMAMAVFFTPMMWVDSSLMRVIQYYSIFALIAVPLSIKDFRNSKTLYWAYMASILAMTLRHNYEYHFLWENIPLSM